MPSSVINNDFYNSKADIWWQEDSPLQLLKTSVNPCRLNYFQKLLHQYKLEPKGRTALEIGCGGGILTEEICKLGFETTGIDPSEESLQHARNHSEKQNLKIKYDHGFGEELPYPDHFFDAVFCCDALEHVSDLNKVISETSRVLKPGGIFFYDTINRTLFSKIVLIKVAQDWKLFALMPKNAHVWDQFIKPKELIHLFKKNNLLHQQHKGTSPSINGFTTLSLLMKRAKGEFGYKEFGEKFTLKESANKMGLYLGYAFKV
jgi:2-polyprenyl-6-hydroxyphenyl methylase/3-demethylubiquinone-9 3-methyltransferase